MAQHWDRDPKTGDYIMDGGSPKQTDSLKIPAYIRMQTRRGSWLYAPNNRWGSDLALSQNKQIGARPAALEAMAAKSLEPLVEDGRAEEIEVLVDAAERGMVSMRARVYTRTGQEEFVLVPIR